MRGLRDRQRRRNLVVLSVLVADKVIAGRQRAWYTALGHLSLNSYNAIAATPAGFPRDRRGVNPTIYCKPASAGKYSNGFRWIPAGERRVVGQFDPFERSGATPSRRMPHGTAVTAVFDSRA